MASITLSNIVGGGGGGGGSTAGAILHLTSNDANISAAQDMNFVLTTSWGGVTYDGGTDTLTLPQGFRFMLQGYLRAFGFTGTSAELQFAFVNESDVAYTDGYEGIVENPDAGGDTGGQCTCVIDTTSAAEEVKLRVLSVGGTDVSIDREGSYWQVWSV